MTRENKVGIAVSCTFLCLAGTVAWLKTREAPAESDGNVVPVASVPGGDSDGRDWPSGGPLASPPPGVITNLSNIKKDPPPTPPVPNPKAPVPPPAHTGLVAYNPGTREMQPPGEMGFGKPEPPVLHAQSGTSEIRPAPPVPSQSASRQHHHGESGIHEGKPPVSEPSLGFPPAVIEAKGATPSAKPAPAALVKDDLHAPYGGPPLAPHAATPEPPPAPVPTASPYSGGTNAVVVKPADPPATGPPPVPMGGFPGDTTSPPTKPADPPETVRPDPATLPREHSEFNPKLQTPTSATPDPVDKPPSPSPNPAGAGTVPGRLPIGDSPPNTSLAPVPAPLARPAPTIASVKVSTEAVYTSKAGDTFASISNQKYLSPAYADALREYNHNQSYAQYTLHTDGTLAPNGLVLLPSIAVLEEKHGSLITKTGTPGAVLPTVAIAPSTPAPLPPAVSAGQGSTPPPLAPPSATPPAPKPDPPLPPVPAATDNVYRPG